MAGTPRQLTSPAGASTTERAHAGRGSAMPPRWAHPASAAPLILLGLITTLGLALRLAGLERKSVWFDEAISARYAALDLPGLLAATSSEANPPLYYLLLHLWLPLGQGDIWLRLPSVVFGSATVLVAALLGRELFGWRAGLLAGLFAALAPFQIDMSQEARAYALLSLLATGSLLLLARARAHGGRTWVAYGVVTGLALYTPYYAFLLLAAQALYLALAMALARRWDWRPWAGLGLAGGLFVPWLPAFLEQLTTLRGSYWIEPPYQGVLWDTYRAFISYSPPDHGLNTEPLLRAGRWVILGLVGLALAGAVRNPRVLLPGLGVAGPVALGLAISAWLTPMYIIRYVSFVVPAFWVVAARGLDALPRAWLRWPLAALVVGSVLVNLPPLYTDPYYNRSDLRAAAELVRARFQPGDLVVHTSLFSEVPFDYYNRGGLQETLLPAGDSAALREASAGYVRLWYVRDFGLLEPEEAERAESEGRAYLEGFTILEQHRLLGVHVFLVERGT